MHEPAKFVLTVDLGSLEVGDLSSLEVMLIKSDGSVLVTNTLNETGFSEHAEVSRITTPFNMGAEENSDWAWDRGAYDIDEETLIENWPSKVRVRFELNGNIYIKEGESPEPPEQE